MKKINCSIHFSLRIWSILLLVLVFCLNVNAQNRKKKVTRKPVKTTVVKPVAKVNKNCAIYSWGKDIRSVQVTKDYIYYGLANQQTEWADGLTRQYITEGEHQNQSEEKNGDDD